MAMIRDAYATALRAAQHAMHTVKHTSKWQSSQEHHDQVMLVPVLSRPDLALAQSDRLLR